MAGTATATNNVNTSKFKPEKVAKTQRTVPCHAHTQHTKVTKKQCVAQYKKTVRARIKAHNQKVKANRELRKRDAAYWPPYPVTTRDLTRWIGNV